MCADVTPFEVKLLRAQVEALEQLLETRKQGQQVERSDDATQRSKLQAETLRALVSATYPSQREDFFHALVCHLAATLKVRYAVIGEFFPNESSGDIQTIAVLANGEFVPNFTYQLKGMPCAHLVQQRSFYCETGIQQRFPQVQLMRDWGIEGYFGIAIYGNFNSLIGVLAVMDTKPLMLSTEVQSLLMLFASRASAEMERSRADEALRRNQERYALATAAGKVGVWELDILTGTYYGDTNLKALYGYTEQELGTDPYVWLNLVHPDDRATAMGAWQAVAGGERDNFLCKLRMQCKDGTILWTEARGQAQRDDHGRLLRMIGATVDITELKLTEEVLCQKERELQRVITERERISQDLHDGILQSLYVVGLGLEASKPLMQQLKHRGKLVKELRQRLDQATGQLSAVMCEIRSFITGLESEIRKGKDLPSAIQHLVESLAQTAPIRFRTSIDEKAASSLSASQALHLFKIMQEAVSNCLRHGRAREARVSLKMLKQGVRLSARDDGKGFPVKTALRKQAGHGMANMAARARNIGGSFTVRSKPGGGTSVILDIPRETTQVHA